MIVAAVASSGLVTQLAHAQTIITNGENKVQKDGSFKLAAKCQPNGDCPVGVLSFSPLVKSVVGPTGASIADLTHP